MLITVPEEKKNRKGQQRKGYKNTAIVRDSFSIAEGHTRGEENKGLGAGYLRQVPSLRVQFSTKGVCKQTPISCLSVIHTYKTEYMLYQKYVSTHPKYTIWSVCYLIAVLFLPFPQLMHSCVHFPAILRRKNYVTGKRIKEEELTAAIPTNSLPCKMPKLIYIPQLPPISALVERK